MACCSPKAPFLAAERRVDEGQVVQLFEPFKQKPDLEGTLLLVFLGISRLTVC
jgi:hypothetical protein